MLRKFPAFLLTASGPDGGRPHPLGGRRSAGPRLETSSEAAPTQRWGFTGLSDGCQSLQADLYPLRRHQLRLYGRQHPDCSARRLHHLPAERQHR